MPGWKAVPENEVQAMAMTTDAAETLPPDATLPSLAELREKHLGEHAVSADAILEETAPMDTTEVVTLRSGELTKKVGVKNGKIAWYQG